MPSLLEIPDENSFKEIYFEYYPIAVRTATYILKNTSAAEDVAQATFLKLWDKREKFNEVTNLKAYVIQMSRNGALDAIKKDNSLGEEHIPLAWNEESDEPDESNLKSTIEKAVSALSPKCRLIFSMSRFEGLTNPEIAEYLEISKRTVETQISAALRLFRTDLKHLFVEFLGATLLVSSYIFNAV